MEKESPATFQEREISPPVATEDSNAGLVESMESKIDETSAVAKNESLVLEFWFCN